MVFLLFFPYEETPGLGPFKGDDPRLRVIQKSTTKVRAEESAASPSSDVRSRGRGLKKKGG